MIDSRRRPLVLVAALAVLLGACGPDETGSAPDREVKAVQEEPAALDTSGMNIPISLDGLPMIDPEWDTAPQYSSGTYLSATARGDVLEFTAVSIHGQTLWSVERPLSCTGFVVAETSDGTPIAVLLDTETSGDAAAAISAAAFHLETGEVAWGPVDLPGTYQGPGLVFAAQPGGFMGDSGPRVALDPDTGSIIAEETDSDMRILGDFSGTLITVEGSELTARNSGDVLWRTDIADFGWDPAALRGSVDELASENYGHLSVDEGPGPVIDLATGEVVRPAATDMGEDPATGTLVLLDEEGLHAFDSENSPLWSITVTPETTLVSVGGIFAFLRAGEGVRAHNVLTGSVAQAYQADGAGTILVPAHMPPQGAALLYDGDGGYLLAAVPEHPAQP